MLVLPESSSAVLVIIRSKSVSICNHSRARLVDSNRNRTFSRGYPNLMHSYGEHLEPRGSQLVLLKSTFNAENFICRLSWSISSDFDAVHSWNVCGSHKSQKIAKNPYFGVQGRSRSSMLVPPECSSAVLVMMRSKSVSICNRSLARLDDSSKNRALWRGYRNLMHLYAGLLEPRRSASHRWNLRLMPNISHAGCPGLSWMVLAQFSLKMCIAASNRWKFTKNPIFGV